MVRKRFVEVFGGRDAINEGLMLQRAMRGQETDCGGFVVGTRE